MTAQVNISLQYGILPRSPVKDVYVSRFDTREEAVKAAFEMTCKYNIQVYVYQILGLCKLHPLWEDYLTPISELKSCEDIT